jgi:hypothetical protein
MQITDYRFGHVTIAGMEYDSDVLITRHGVRERWRRRSGHSLSMEDLEDLLTDPPRTLVVGTGFYGRMQVPRETELGLSRKGVQLRCLVTAEAVAEFNRLQERDAAVAAALHLTC